VRRELDVIIWVETPQSIRESRDAARVAAGEISATSYANWMAEENAIRPPSDHGSMPT